GGGSNAPCTRPLAKREGGADRGVIRFRSPRAVKRNAGAVFYLRGRFRITFARLDKKHAPSAKPAWSRRRNAGAASPRGSAVPGFRSIRATDGLRILRHLGDHCGRLLERVVRDRHAAVDRLLQNDLLDVVGGEAAFGQ